MSSPRKETCNWILLLAAHQTPETKSKNLLAVIIYHTFLQTGSLNITVPYSSKYSSFYRRTKPGCPFSSIALFAFLGQRNTAPGASLLRVSLNGAGVSAARWLLPAHVVAPCAQHGSSITVPACYTGSKAEKSIQVQQQRMLPRSLVKEVFNQSLFSEKMSYGNEQKPFKTLKQSQCSNIKTQCQLAHNATEI